MLADRTPLGVPVDEHRRLQEREAVLAAGRAWAADLVVDLAVAWGLIDQPYRWEPQVYSPSAGAYVRELLNPSD
jgi:hypothetical protein